MNVTDPTFLILGASAVACLLVAFPPQLPRAAILARLALMVVAAVFVAGCLWLLVAAVIILAGPA